MKRYFNYLLHEMFPSLFGGIAKFVGETLIFIKTYFWVILIVLAVKPANDDQRVGVDIIRRALQAPVRQIAANAGEDGAVIAGKLLEGDKTNIGYNAQTVRSRSQRKERPR